MRKSWVPTVICIYILSFWGCASLTTPTGGPKDEAPPILIKSIPTHKQINFNKPTIELEFNELVALYNPKDEILISPSVGKDIEFKVKNNIVKITSPKGWQNNTTYSVSFREGIRDVTENNTPKNFRLAFSTGPLIDSLMVRGKIKLALKESIPENITVALYQSDTFNIFEHNPSYFTITDKAGNFSLENIRDGHYKVYAFDDKNKNLKVESRTEKYGFLSEAFDLIVSIDSLSIPMLNLDARKPTINSFRNNGVYSRVKFNKYVKSYSFSHNSNTQIINSYGDDQSEIVFYNPKEIQDSISIFLAAFDSLDFKIDTTLFIKPLEPNFIPSDFNARAGSIKYDPTTSTFSHNFVLTKPLLSVTYDSIFIQVDSTNVIGFNADNFSYDSIYKKLSIQKGIPLDSLFRTIISSSPDSVTHTNNSEKKESDRGATIKSRTKSTNFKPVLKLRQGAIISVESDSSKFREFDVPPITKNQTGTLLIQTITNQPHFIIQLFNSGGEIIEEVKNITSHTFNNLPAQSYKIRVIIDQNNNGVWDPGNFFLMKEPEPVYLYQTADKKYDFPIRANWELGPLMLIF